MAKTPKRLKQILLTHNPQKQHSIIEGVEQVKKSATAKFNETIEIAIDLNIDSKKSDQAIRGIVKLPSGTGKNVRVAVFARGAKAEEARSAGAEVVGAEDLAQKITAGEINFDHCIATPDMMGVVGSVAKILGIRKLMPNPKLGTITNDVTQAVNDAKGGQVEYRSNKQGVVHAAIGKASFDVEALQKNVTTFIEAITRSRPAGVKGNFIQSAVLSSTMGPAVPLSLSSSSKSAGK